MGDNRRVLSPTGAPLYLDSPSPRLTMQSIQQSSRILTAVNYCLLFNNLAGELLMLRKMGPTCAQCIWTRMRSGRSQSARIVRDMLKLRPGTTQSSRFTLPKISKASWLLNKMGRLGAKPGDGGPRSRSTGTGSKHPSGCLVTTLRPARCSGNCSADQWKWQCELQ